jgi:hypothetical protein
MDKKAQERVLIAKDALKWVKAGVLTPMAGDYIVPENDLDPYDYGMDKVQLRDIVLGKCQVCMKGALFLAKAVRYNNVLASQLDLAQCSMDTPMNEHFSPVQLSLIESAFEGWDHVEGCEEFNSRYPDDSDRMIAILKNIIKNKGTFILPKE